ncbi:TIGR03086 family metal-binding protein [Mycobacterium sp.]|uniref:TIGR03086 family metal-binding protein n=1 Tax=Mycobacterium sp. TaxID=1785 RepID=UPI003D107768
MPSDLRPGPDSPPADELRAAEAALGVLQHIVHPISRDDLSRPTTSGDFDVAQLTDHMVETIASIGAALDANLPTRDADDSVERQIIVVGRPTLDAFHSRHGLDGAVTWRGTETPVRILASVLAFGLLVHGWDYAAAIGHPANVPDSLANYVLDLAQKIITPERRANGEFGDPVEVDENAPAIHRLVAFTGRDPATKL